MEKKKRRVGPGAKQASIKTTVKKPFNVIQHPYNVGIIEVPYYKRYLGNISAQKAPRCLSASYLEWQTCCSNCYLHTNRVDVLKTIRSDG